MNPVDVLRGAKEILSDETRWIKGSYGKGGWPSQECQNYCAAGALIRASAVLGKSTGPEWFAARAELVHAIGSEICPFNDDPATTHADLIDAFDRAILSLADKSDRAAEPVLELGRES